MTVKKFVLDLVDNGGGSLDYGLKLAEALKGTNANEPKLELRLNDNWLNSYQQSSIFATSHSMREIAKRHFAMLKEDVAAGRRLSRLIDFRRSFAPIQSSANAQPIPVVLMVNEMCASMCDIFSADLKDAGVARLIGTRTMGAGGNVTMHTVSPRLQLGLSQTESLVVRANGKYVENEGVEVDRAYVRQLTDLTGKDSEFIKAAIAYSNE
jgi:C-terminal processing protease CtpA/Prc